MASDYGNSIHFVSEQLAAAAYYSGRNAYLVNSAFLAESLALVDFFEVNLRSCKNELIVRLYYFFAILAQHAVVESLTRRRPRRPSLAVISIRLAMTARITS